MSRTIIENKAVPMREYLRRMYRYRSMMFTLARRDLKARYAQTSLGILWAIIQPSIALAIFWVFFEGFIHLETGNIPYPVFAFSGMVLWYYFSGIINNGGTSLIQHQELIRKIYFPRLILPLSKLFTGLVEMLISLVLLTILMIALKVGVSWRLVFIPGIILLVMMTGLMVSVWLSALTVRRRDFQHLIPYLVNYGIWLTPVFYPVTIVPEQYHDWIYLLNPMATAIEMFRWALLGTAFEGYYCLSFVWVFILLVAGIYLFRKTERNIADYV